MPAFSSPSGSQPHAPVAELSLGSAVQPLSVEEEMGLGYSFGDAGEDMDGNLEADRLNSKSFLSFQG